MPAIHRELIGADRTDCVHDEEDVMPMSKLANRLDVVQMADRRLVSIDQQRRVSIVAELAGEIAQVQIGSNRWPNVPPLTISARSDVSRKLRTVASMAAVPEPVSKATEPSV